MENDIWFVKDMLTAFDDKDYDYGYYPDKGYYKNCSLECVDTEFVAIPYRLVTSQYLTFDSEMNVCNHAYLNQYVERDEGILENMIKNCSGKVDLIDLAKNGFIMIILKRDQQGIFRELVSNQEISTSPIPVSFPLYGKWSNFNSLYVDYLKEDLNTLFDFPIVYDGSFIFEMNDEERKYIERYSRNVFKDTMMKGFKKMRSDAIKNNKMVLNVMENFISDDKNDDYIYSTLKKKK